MTEPTKPTLITGEWDALWSWHHDQEFNRVNRQDYGEAEWHKERQRQILPFTSFAARRSPQVTAAGGDHG